MSFSNTLNFTSSNEDGATELAALKLSNADRVLCLTASGTRVLDLLLGDPGEIVAIDINDSQNALLALKMAAIRVLDADDLYAYLGVTPLSDRHSLHEQVCKALPDEWRVFWSRKERQIMRGIWLSGRWERVLRFGAFGTRLIRRGNIEKLFAAKTLEQQSDFWDKKFNDWIWDGAIRSLSKKWIWTHVIGEPGGAFLPSGQACSDYLRGKFTQAAQSFFLRESDFASLLFRGRHEVEEALPLHLRRENLDVVRANLDRVSIKHIGLAGMTKLNMGEFTGFSLSDFGSYCGQEGYDACWRGVVETASNGARYCERSFMNKIDPSSELQSALHRDVALSTTLSQTDKAIIYDINCGVLAL